MSLDRVRGAKSYVVLIALRDGLPTGRVIVPALRDNLTTADGPEAATSIAVPWPQRKRHKRRHR